MFGACVQGVHTRWWHRCRTTLLPHSYIYDRATTTSRTSFLVSAIISYQ